MPTAHLPRFGLACLGAAALATSVACAGRTTVVTRGAASALEAEPESRRKDLVTWVELAKLNVNSLYDALVRLRPEALRGPPTIAQPDGARPLVYVNEMLVGDVSELARLQVLGVREVRILSPVAAAIRFGRVPPGGAILVSTR